MGWSFRKSVKVGPFRLNFSKSGVGASVGIRGLRIGAGPRGTHLTVSGGGVQYRKRIGVPARRAAQPTVAQPVQAVPPQRTSLFEVIVAVVFIGWVVKCSVESREASAPAAARATKPVPAASATAPAPEEPKPAPAQRPPAKSIARQWVDKGAMRVKEPDSP